MHAAGGQEIEQNRTQDTLAPEVHAVAFAVEHRLRPVPRERAAVYVVGVNVIPVVHRRVPCGIAREVAALRAGALVGQDLDRMVVRSAIGGAFGAERPRCAVSHAPAPAASL